MFGTLGGPEVILILVVALIVFGPRRLPEIGKSMGKMLAEFRKASNDFKRTIEDELEAEKSRETTPAPPLPEATTPVPSSVTEPVPPVESAPVESAPSEGTPLVPPAPSEVTASDAAATASPAVAPGGGTTAAAPAVEPRVEPPAEAVVSR